MLDKIKRYESDRDLGVWRLRVTYGAGEGHFGPADRLLESLRSHPNGEGAARIGRVEAREPTRAPVILETAIGGERPLDLLSGAELPRIC